MLVVNANVVFSCIMRNKALELLFQLYDKGVKTISPDFILDGFKENVSKISKSSKLSEESVLAFASNLFSEFITIAPKSEYAKFLLEAKGVAPHLKDAPYFALSLAFDKAPIWSREPRLKRQKVVKVLHDKEVEEYFGLIKL